MKKQYKSKSKTIRNVYIINIHSNKRYGINNKTGLNLFLWIPFFTSGVRRFEEHYLSLDFTSCINKNK